MSEQEVGEAVVAGLPENAETGKADVDGSEMVLHERGVDLPDRVLVVDAKLGKEIGFVDRDKVMEILESDSRYEGFEDGCTGKFMLAYHSDRDGSKAIVLEAEDLAKFLSVVEANLDTAMAADDLKKMRFGVSYEAKGRAYAMFLHVSEAKRMLPYLAEDLAEAVRGPVLPLKDAGALENLSPSERIIQAMRRRAAK